MKKKKKKVYFVKEPLKEIPRPERIALTNKHADSLHTVMMNKTISQLVQR